MEGELPPVQRFRLRHEGSGQSEIADPPLPKPTILPAKKRIEPHQEYWLPDLNEPATSCCLPAKKRVWALPPLSPVKSTSIFAILDAPKEKEKAPSVWAVKKKRTEKIVKKAGEKLNKEPAEEEKPKVEKRWKEKPEVVETEREEDPEIKEEVVLAEEPAKEHECMAEESEVEAKPEAEDHAVEDEPPVQEPMEVEMALAEHLKEESLETMYSEEVAPNTEQTEESLETMYSEEVAHNTEQTEEEHLKAEVPVKQDLLTEAACGPTDEVCVEDDDGVICAVCRSTDGDADDPIVFCDGCDLMVHASCYGNPLSVSIPEGDWFCARCEASKADDGHYSDRWCCLCPAEGGVTKPTTDGRWAHVLCALLVPEVFFRDPAGRDGVDLSRVPARRWKRWCCLCGKAGEGCVVDCSEAKCALAFHVSCAMDADLCVEYRPSKTGDIVVGFCSEHTELWRKQQSTGRFKFVPRD